MFSSVHTSICRSILLVVKQMWLQINLKGNDILIDA
jgi:hypothetical protein